MARIWLAMVLTAAAARAEAATVLIDSVEGLRQAIAAARPGDTLELGPGSYDLAGHGIEVGQPGTAQAPIVLRGAGRLGSIVLKVASSEGFLVSAPHWRFEKLVMQGVCAADDDCEHAFHVVGGATGVVIRDSRLVDFNSAIKVNGLGGAFPDGGLVEGTAIVNSRARRTANPVTGIDIVGASGWVVRGNLIADLAKGGGNHVSYGAFMKGGGEGGVFENNLVACTRAVPSQSWGEERIGLSFGGGGTEDAYCRRGACLFEHRGGVLRNNVVERCSDVGIYLNRASETRILHNTLTATGGIDVRFADSSAVARNNTVDGRIRERDGGRVEVAASPARLADAPTDFCGRARPASVSAGAVEASLPGCDPQDLTRR